MWRFDVVRRIGREGRLRYFVLWLLNEGPKTGAELINDIEKMTWGWWRPSPGSVYPLLHSMMSEGLIIRLDDGRYKLTDKGQTEAKDLVPFRRVNTIDEMLNEIEGYLLYLEDIDRAKIEPYKERLIKIKERVERLIKVG
jgi:DNA-binding PadR family transcriptional regulator